MGISLDPSPILQTGFGFWSSKVLLSAVELGVFTILKERKMTGAKLAKEIGMHPRGIGDFFDARRENLFGLLMSLNMLIEFGDAFDYSDADFQEWCREAGFERFDVIHPFGPSSAAIAYK